LIDAAVYKAAHSASNRIIIGTGTYHGFFRFKDTFYSIHLKQ